MRTFILPCRYTDIGKVLFFHNKHLSINYLLIITYNKIYYYDLNKHAHIFTLNLPMLINYGNMRDIKTCIDEINGICYIYQNTNNTWIKWNVLNKKLNYNYYTHSANTITVMTCYDFDLLSHGVSGILKQKKSRDSNIDHKLFHLSNDLSGCCQIHPVINIDNLYITYPQLYKTHLQIWNEHCLDISKIHVLVSLIKQWNNKDFYVFYLFSQLIYFIKIDNVENIVVCYDVFQHGVLYYGSPSIIPVYDINIYTAYCLWIHNQHELCIVANIKREYSKQICKFIINTYSFYDIIPYELVLFRQNIIKHNIECYIFYYSRQYNIQYNMLINHLINCYYPIFI